MTTKSAFIKILLATACLASSIIPARAEGDAARGERAYSKCAACHNIDNPRTRMGPHLMGVVGRPAGSVSDFSHYSQAMKDAATAGVVWNDEELKQFLASPKKFLPGTSMRFFGLWSETEIDDIIAYLKTKPAPPAE